eukprot:g4205.t1
MHRAAKYDPKQLTLTRDNGPLSLQQRLFYEKNGYVVVKKVFAPGTFDYIHRHYIDVCRNKSKYVGKRVISLVRDINVVKGLDDKSHLPKEFSVIKMNGFCGIEGEDEVFTSYMRHRNLLPYIQQFIDSNVASTASHMYVCKPPGLSKSTVHPMHQDLLYFPQGERDDTGALTRRSKRKIVAAWTALGPCNIENGCLTMIPGSHWVGLRTHGYPKCNLVNLAYFGIVDLTDQELDSMVHLDMEDGDVVFFHPETIHGSGFNQRRVEEAHLDDAFRRAISVHFYEKGMEMANWEGLPHGKTARTANSPPNTKPSTSPSPRPSSKHTSNNPVLAKKFAFISRMANLDVDIEKLLNNARM